MSFQIHFVIFASSLSEKFNLCITHTRMFEAIATCYLIWLFHVTVEFTEAGSVKFPYR